MLISDVFPDGRSLMLFNALIKVSACKANIICISQITLKMVYNALLVHNRGLAFFWLDVRSHLSACVQGMLFRFFHLILFWVKVFALLLSSLLYFSFYQLSFVTLSTYFHIVIAFHILTCNSYFLYAKFYSLF